MDLSNFIWSVADLIRGPYRPPQYERVMLPMTVLRRFDCVLAKTKPAVLKRYKQLEGGKVKNLDPIMNQVAGGGIDIGFHNHSDLDFEKLKGEPDAIALNLMQYIKGFSANVRDIFLEYFEFQSEIEKLDEANRLYLVVQKFADIDLGSIESTQMGTVFEDLVRRFNEAANETAGDHFTPREVVRLMVNLLLEPDSNVFGADVIKTMLDPTCGTGGMLAVSQNWIRQHNDRATLAVYGQDYNKRAYAIAASDMLIKEHNQHSQIEFGNTLTQDKFPGMRFDYFLANPPFGVNWETERKFVKAEHEKQGKDGRFEPGLPRISDGALLFLLHMVSKFQEYEPGNDEKQGSRLGIVFNGSPLFTGGAGSGESEIRRWIIEKDWLEAIVALPESMFYNTGIGTYVWVVSNRKEKHRTGKIQMIDARERWAPMRRSLGDKRRYITDEQVEEISREHGKFKASETCKLFDNEDFGSRRITVERPLRLKFQLTPDGREQFLDQCPHLLDLLQAFEREIGMERCDDWNEVLDRAEEIAKAEDTDWVAKEKAFFQTVFTEIDPDCAPVVKKVGKSLPAGAKALIQKRAQVTGLTKVELARVYGYASGGPGSTPAGRGAAGTAPSHSAVQYEADTKLRDFENVPLKEPIEKFFLREVRPYVADAWINDAVIDDGDKGVGKVGYEINFNRYFYRYEPPRPLAEIDEELAAVEKRVVELLSKVTE